MSVENPGEQEPIPAPPDHTLLPPQPEFPSTPPPWSPGPPPALPPSPMWSKVAAFIVLIAFVAAAAGAGIGWSLAKAVSQSHQIAQSNGQPESPLTPVNPGAGGSNSNNSSADSIAAKVIPAIVDVNTTLGNGQAAGTGMIISSTGEILTNNHVVTGSTSINVTVHGRSQSYSAHVVGVNVAQDVAVIQIDQSVSGLPTVTFANSSSLKVGDSVVAIGNALGQGGTPRAFAGHITALNQTITASEGRQSSETLSGMVQSDAVIYEGDSGGALVNTSGQVVGMITAGEAQGFRSAASDIGYAVSSNTAIAQANRIRAQENAPDLTYGQVGYLGVSVQDSSTTNGVLVVGVQSGSPADAAGITAGSVITRIGGTSVDSSDSLGNAIKAHSPGERVSVSWISADGGSRSATVTLGAINP